MEHGISLSLLSDVDKKSTNRSKPRLTRKNEPEHATQNLDMATSIVVHSWHLATKILILRQGCKADICS